MTLIDASGRGMDDSAPSEDNVKPNRSRKAGPKRSCLVTHIFSRAAARWAFVGHTAECNLGPFFIRKPPPSLQVARSDERTILERFPAFVS